MVIIGIHCSLLKSRIIWMKELVWFISSCLSPFYPSIFSRQYIYIYFFFPRVARRAQWCGLLLLYCHLSILIFSQLDFDYVIICFAIVPLNNPEKAVFEQRSMFIPSPTNRFFPQSPPTPFPYRFVTSSANG